MADYKPTAADKPWARASGNAVLSGVMSNGPYGSDKVQNSQMNTAQGIADHVRHQGVYGREKTQQELPVDHPDATLGD